MEARKITVVSTKNQKKSVIMSSATTLAELKNDLDANNVDYEGMTFFEGTSKTELKTDESVLPHDVPFKGQTTNELVFMLTNPNKKISSGVISSRKEAGAFFKANPDKAAEFKESHEGKNWTNCATVDILDFINNSDKVEESEEGAFVGLESEPIKESEDNSSLKKAFSMLLDDLYDEDILSSEQLSRINKVLDGDEVPEKINLESSYSDDEIDDMFDGMY